MVNSHVSFDRAWYVIDVLRFNERLEVVLQDFGEVILKFGSAEVFQDLLPVRWVLEGQHLTGSFEKVRTDLAHIVSAQVGLEFSSENFKCCALSDAIRSDEAKNLPRSGSGKPMELESVGSIPVGDLRLEVGRKIDDGNSFKGTSYKNSFERNENRPCYELTSLHIFHNRYIGTRI